MYTSKYSDEYVLYFRKSSDEPDNQKNSIQYQLTEGLKYSENHQLPIADVNVKNICEHGIVIEHDSAFKTSGITINSNGKVSFGIKRLKFQWIVVSLQKRLFKGVIFLCWDRSSRNDLDDIVLRHLMEEGADVHFVQTKYENTSAGQLHMDIDSLFSKHYTRISREKIKNTYHKLIKEGKYPRRSPIGYLDEGPDNKPLDPERSLMVKRLFELYSVGNWSYSQLAKWANQKGLTTKPVRRKRNAEEKLYLNIESIPKAPRPISSKLIENTLKNPFYTGRILTDEDEYVIGNHPPLIDLALFQKVQEVMNAKCVSVHYVDKPFFIFRGFIKCKCGRAYSPYRKKGINYYRSKCLPNCSNTVRNIRERIFDESVEEILGRIHFSDNELQDIENASGEKLDTYANKRNDRLRELENERKRIYHDLDYLKKQKVTLLRTGAYSIQEFSESVSRLDVELERVDIQMKELYTDEKHMLQYVLTFSELVKRAREYYKNAIDTEKHNICTTIFSELTFYNSDLLNIKAKSGFDTLFLRHSRNFGGAKFLFSELSDIYFEVKTAFEDLSKLKFLTPTSLIAEST